MIRLCKDGKVNIKRLKRLFLMIIFASTLLTSDIEILAEEQGAATDAVTGVEISVTTMMYAVDKADVRKEPNTSSEILGELEAGTNIFAVELTDEGWYRVVYAGETGYIRGDFLAVYSDMESWLASEPEPVPLELPETADNGQEEQSSNKKNILAILIIILLVLIFVYAVIQIVIDNMKSHEGTEEDSEDKPDKGRERKADDDNEWEDDGDNVYEEDGDDEWKYDEENEQEDDDESDFEIMDLDDE